MFKNAMILVLLLALFPIQVNAETSAVMQDRSAGGFHYKLITEGRAITWEIGHENHKRTFQESNENEETLESFREAVNEVAGHRFTLIISAGYFVIVCITTMITYKKRKHLPRSVGMVITCLAGLGLYFALTNYIDMEAALQDAGYYYGSLLVD
ncbi:hypothetical protein NQ095_12695 [Rossellomorea sp. SC111]|uniref:hypothetical protein n=1 Tax=Rossellomorea sp. SC111 TaxID=2968985 RepID=UPI00215ADCE2|nr:hypothetical protein [Rossellomorea sp. SC111]MCR8849273.1 hypothetical protein [Rossellomorea sp. SC111]